MMQTKEICHVGRCPRGCQEVCQQAVEMLNAPRRADPWKLGDEFKPFHPQCSNVEPAYRDGWNACYEAARRELLARQVPSGIALHHMGTEEKPHQWYLDGPDFYCDVERDIDGKFSVFIRDFKTGAEGFADQADPPSPTNTDVSQPERGDA